MAGQPQAEALGDHRYLVRARQDEEIVEIRVQATPAVIARLTGGEAGEAGEADETRVIVATAAYLIARQRADDLPAQLDLDDVAAAYPGFEDDLRRSLSGGQAGGTGAGGRGG